MQRYAITGEVFAFNNFLVAALVHQLVYYWYAPTDTKAFAGALLCGIAMSNQVGAHPHASPHARTGGWVKGGSRCRRRAPTRFDSRTHGRVGG